MRPLSAPAHVDRRRRARHKRLVERGFRNYRSYLASSTWREIRERYYASDLPQACLCGETRVQLHHLTYDRVGGDELLTDLQPLCAACHSAAHVLESRKEIPLDLDGFYDGERAAAHRQSLTLVESERRMKAEAFHELPLHERVRRLRLLSQAGYGKALRNHVTKIDSVLRKAEDKVAFGDRRRAVRSVENLARKAATHVLDTAAPAEIDALVDGVDAQQAA